MANLIQKAVDAIIRPPRTEYDQESIPKILEGDDEVPYIRHPLGFINKRNIPIVGSYYHKVGADPTGGGMCVLYLHGNASSQLEGQFLVPNLCKYDIFVCCFDFAGCGCSGGEYVSLGYFEKEDTEFLLDQLHKYFNLGPFILWGRSMGAATALLVDYPLVLARISDSSFTSVPDMCAAIAESMHLPSPFVPAVVWFLKKQVIQQANFDFEEVSPISVQRQNEVPAVFGHAEKDQFIPFEQCRRLYGHYPTKEKSIMMLDGGHNSRRKEAWIRLGVSFILKIFCIDVKDPVISTCRKLQQSVFHFSSFSAMMGETEKPNLTGLEGNYMDEEETKKEKPKSVENGENGENDEKKKKKKRKRKDKEGEEVDENGEKKRKHHKHKHHKHKKDGEKKDEDGDKEKNEEDLKDKEEGIEKEEIDEEKEGEKEEADEDENNEKTQNESKVVEEINNENNEKAQNESKVVEEVNNENNQETVNGNKIVEEVNNENNQETVNGNKIVEEVINENSQETVNGNKVVEEASNENN